jgi:urease gamma subunit
VTHHPDAADVMDGIAEMIPDIQVEATFLTAPRYHGISHRTLSFHPSHHHEN